MYSSNVKVFVLEIRLNTRYYFFVATQSCMWLIEVLNLKSSFINNIGQKLRSRRLTFWAFPLFLNVMLCLNLVPSPSLLASSGPVILDVAAIARFLLTALLLALVYLTLCAVVRKPYVAAIITTVPFYALSVWDFYKFFSLGTRVAAADIPMVFSLGDMWTPAGTTASGLFVSPLLLVTAPCLFLYIRKLRLCRAERAVPALRKRAKCLVLAAWLGVSLFPSGLASQIFVPQVSAYEAVPSGGENPTLSSIDCLIGSLYYDDATDTRATQENTAALLAPYSPSSGTGVTPDVIVVMSESFFDLNQVNGINLNQDIYTNFKRMQAQNGVGKIVVPAFGGGTASTELEVISGTANASLSNTRDPYAKLNADEPVPSYAQYFSELGYDTTYIHPFKSTFYNRNNAMKALGFDNLIFEDSMGVPLRDYPRDMHISDETLTNEIITTLDASDAPQFIYATSMQNHTPFVDQSESDDIIVTLENPSALEDAEFSALNAYAVGLRDTDAALGRLLDYAEHAPNPTAVLFFGDHQPLLDAYKQLNEIDTETIFEDQTNLMTDFGFFTNYESPNAKIENAPENNTFSAYYLMDVFLTSIEMPKTQYMAFLDTALAAMPVYSCHFSVTNAPVAEVSRAKEALDILSYDRIWGDKFSS